jgi:tetrahydromethanopterin S-methyltransferase subunit C
MNLLFTPISVWISATTLELPMSVARWLLVDEEAASSVSSAVVVNAMAANSPSSACLGIRKSRSRQLWLPGTNPRRLFVSSALVSVGGGGMVTLLLLPVVVYILISLLGLWSFHLSDSHRII